MLARERRSAHAVQTAGFAREGENLWTGTRAAYLYDEVVGMWAGEQSDFVNGAMLAISRANDWHRVGHYSQIVWRGTTRVGCSLASNSSDAYLVCRYAPAGNVTGQRAF